MARYYKSITQQQLEILISAELIKCNGEFDDLCHQGKIRNDLNKVNFDFENFEYEYSEDRGWKGDFVGYKALGDFNFLMAYAGGDWEHPVVFIIYYDGKDLRGYVPKSGNCWNYKTKEAFGNDINDEDQKFIEKYFKLTDNTWSEHIDIMYNLDDMLAEIGKHFVRKD
ncbi:hypothetical protein [Acinetobacter sp.]|uniref:hypothetical protein n=1 Tax=Acinetobacter sp. TaxID=472 RepID=UPI0037525333